jgi:hypothetical protein
VKWRWPWQRAEDTTDEAQAQLRKLERRDPEVERLGRELRKRQQQNNFSGLVAEAITRRAQKGS